MILVYYLMGTVTAILFLNFFIYKRRIMKYVGHLPSPPEVPFFGSGLYFLGKNSVEMMDMLCMATGMLETPCRFWLGPILAVFLAKPEDIQTVMLSPQRLDKPYIYGTFMDDCHGLFSAPTTTIGVNLEFQSNKNVEVLDCMESQSELIGNRMAKFWLHPHFIFRWTQAYKDYQRNLKCLYELTGKIRKMREKEFYESKCFEKVEELKEDEFFTTPQTFVNELFKLHHQNLLDDRMLDDHILTVMVGTQTSDTDADIISKLDYLEMCIKETMRLFPVAPFLGISFSVLSSTINVMQIDVLGRQNEDDIKLSNCTVPKGTMLIMSCHYLHRNKEIWGPNADMFNPDNFLPEKIASRHAYSFLPFSAGSRNCIGIKYAWLSMKVTLSLLLRQYKFSTNLRFEDIVTKFEVTLKIENGHLVTVERRDGY